MPNFSFRTSSHHRQLPVPAVAVFHQEPPETVQYTIIMVLYYKLILLLLVPFSYKLMHHLKPFAVVVLNGEITVQC